MAAGLSARLLARGSALCLVAGYVDAIGYTELGGVFAANMTGNSVLFAIAAARGEGVRAAAYVLTLASFFLGALAAAGLRRWTGRAAVPLLAAALLMLGASAVGAHDPKLALLALAMGLQGASVSRFGPVALQTVVVTGTIVRLSETIVARLASPSTPPEPGSVRLHAFAWIAYGLGAAAAIGAQHVMSHPLWAAATLLLVVAGDVGAARER
jgi:uncharacterized membrane protein YoaK (UPF0700 family)